MTCSRCGKSATLKRGDVPYCGACSLSLDWQELTRLIQDARVETPVAGQPEVIARAG